MLLNNRAWIWVGVVVCKYQTKRHRAHGDDGGGVHAGKLIVEIRSYNSVKILVIEHMHQIENIKPISKTILDRDIMCQLNLLQADEYQKYNYVNQM